MALVGVELETLVSEPDALTARPLSCAYSFNFVTLCPTFYEEKVIQRNEKHGGQCKQKN